MKKRQIFQITVWFVSFFKHITIQWQLVAPISVMVCWFLVRSRCKLLNVIPKTSFSTLVSSSRTSIFISTDFSQVVSLDWPKVIWPSRNLYQEWRGGRGGTLGTHLSPLIHLKSVPNGRWQERGKFAPGFVFPQWHDKWNTIPTVFQGKLARY